MIDLDEAIAKVQNTYLKGWANENYAEDELIILNDKIIDKPDYWVIPYTSKLWYETKDMSYAIAGNAPIIVNKISGELIETGTACSLEVYMNNYEKRILKNIKPSLNKN